VPKRRPRPIGRPSKLTPEILDSICGALEMGVPEKYAAASYGIAESTFHEWMKKGAAGIEPYAAFRQAVTRSSAQAVSNLVVRGLAGGKGSRAACWILERRFPGEYGRHAQIEDA
jgi:hypothetical protein